LRVELPADDPAPLAAIAPQSQAANGSALVQQVVAMVAMCLVSTGG
jgi:hypothetical protein